MARTITIAGIDRAADVKLDEFSIEQVLTYQEDNCSFVIKAGDKPTTGQEIIVSSWELIDNVEDIDMDTADYLFEAQDEFDYFFLQEETRHFAGTIDKADDDPRAPGVTFYKCQARDYTFMLDRRLVVEVYENWAADDIIRDIITRYCSGFTSANVLSGAPIIETTGSDFNYLRPSECFKWLCDYTGWQWYVDYDKDVHFFNPSALAESAPETIDASANFRDFRNNLEIEGLRNRVYVQGGTMLSDLVTYEYKADGVQRAWTLPYKPHSLTVSVAGGAAITPGIENIDEESTKTWMMNYQEKLIRLATGEADIADGTTVAFTFKYDIDVITYREDTVSQAAIAAIQGGDGIHEHNIVDDSLTTLDAAGAVADADLREHADPRVKGSFQHDTDGWAPGQLVSIHLPAEGVDNTYLIQRVTMTPIDTDSWTYRVEYGGRLLGIADFLKALVSAQQKKKLGETEILHKIKVVRDDIVDLTDTLATTPRIPPYICGDADAICGFVLLAPAVLPAVGTTLEDCTWQEITLISIAGLAATYFAVGDEKIIELSTGEEVTLQIYDFDHDTKTAGGTAGITFGSKDLLAGTSAMNDSRTNATGWTHSDMRTWISETLLGQLPEDLQAVIKQVDKLTSEGNKSTTIETTADKLFLFSEIEVFGAVTYSQAGEGSMYPIFSDAASRIKNRSGAADMWWERSPRPLDSTRFCYVAANGTVNVYYAEYQRGVAFGFCV